MTNQFTFKHDLKVSLSLFLHLDWGGGGGLALTENAAKLTIMYLRVQN